MLKPKKTNKKNQDANSLEDISLDDLAVMDPGADTKDDEQDDDLGNIDD